MAKNNGVITETQGAGALQGADGREAWIGEE